jgi:rhodanese-related sulfurtransferase
VATVLAAELSAAIAAGAAPTIIDVRSRAEFVRGHVPGAIHIPFWLMSRRISSLSKSPEDPIVVYCGHGPRAWIAGAALRRHGFRQVSYLAGHMTGWSRTKLPEERG